MKPTTTTLCAALAVVAALVTGCTSDGPAPAGNTGDTQGVESSAGVEQRDIEAIVEQTVVSDPESPGDRAVIGIQSLTVDGPTMVLRLVVTPDFASVGDSEEIDLNSDVWNNSCCFFGVTLRLLDRDNLKEYSVISDGNLWWASAGGEVTSTNGEPMYAFAVFAAPEDDIDTIDVRLNEQWPEFTDVPITR